MAVENYEIVIAGNVASQYVATVLHAKVTIATPVNPYLTALALIQDFDGSGSLEAFVDMLPTEYTVTSIRAKKVGSGGGVTAVVLQAALTFNQGSRVGDVDFSATNPVLTLITVTDVNSPGRIYLPGVSEDDISENILAAGLVTAMQAFATAFKTGGTLGGVDNWVGGVYRRALNTVDTIIGGQASPLIGTQRRRSKPI